VKETAADARALPVPENPSVKSTHIRHG